MPPGVDGASPRFAAVRKKLEQMDETVSKIHSERSFMEYN